MYIAAREREILQLLLEQTGVTTVKDVAMALQVSERTVHRSLKNVEDFLRMFDLRLERKPGIGIRINGSTEKKEELTVVLRNATCTELTPNERQKILLCSLLDSKEPVKLSTLADELDVTVGTLSHDLSKVNEWLTTFKLSLLRKRGYGVQVVGSEFAKRRAISSLILENITEADFFDIIRADSRRSIEKNTDPVFKRLIGIVQKENLLIAEKAMKECKEKIPYSLADGAYIGLILHLAIVLVRLQKGEKIDLLPQTFSLLKKEREYTIATQIVEKLYEISGWNIPDVEIGYITMHLKGAKLRNVQAFDLEGDNFVLSLHVRDLIEHVSNTLKVDFTNDYTLFQGLVTHLQPAIFRITQNLDIHNPYLDEIKKSFNDLFAIVKEEINKVFPCLPIPDEEIGYIVLHFASSLERIIEKTGYRALVLCTNGIGASKILATRIKSEIPEIKLLEYASVFDINTDSLNEYDVIISTIPLPSFPSEYILVNPILTKDDVNNIRTWLQKRKIEWYKANFRDTIHNVGTSHKVFVDKSQGEHVLSFRDIHEYAGVINTLLEDFRLTICDTPSSIEDIVRKACHELECEDVLTRPEIVFKVLMERHCAGDVGIPGSSLVLCHARNPYVHKPSFTLWRWDSPLTVGAMDGTEIQATTLMLMLAPEKTSKLVLEVLSYISVLVIENKESIELFRSCDQETIVEYLNEKFHRFLRDKWIKY